LSKVRGRSNGMVLFVSSQRHCCNAGDIHPVCFYLWTSPPKCDL
jgi:hypothetical protein